MRHKTAMRQQTVTSLYLILAIAVMTVLALSGCASIDDQAEAARPDWVDGNSTQYSRLKYIIGRGQAESLAIAQDRARTNIAKTFQVVIQAQSSDSQEITQRSNEQGSHASRSSRISQHINTQTRQIINGIEIAEIWQDPATGHYYSLAILARQPAATRLRQQIEQLDAATLKSITASRTGGDPLTRAGFAAQALAAQLQRAAYQKMATVVDLSGQGITARWQTTRLKADLDALLKRIRIQPAGSGKNDEVIIPMLAAALATAGLTPDNEGNSDYILTGQLTISDLGQRDDWYWQRAVINIQLTDKASEQLIGSRSWSRLKAAGLDSDTAKRRLLEQLEEKLKQDMRQAVLDMAIAK